MPTDREAGSIERRWSLRRRLLIAGTVIVVSFMLLVGVTLEQAFRTYALQAAQDRLQARIFLLMGAAEFNAEGDLSMPATLPEAVLELPEAASVAAVLAEQGALLWQSETGISVPFADPPALLSGEPAMTELTADGQRFLTLTYPVIWELETGGERTLWFVAAETRARLEAEVADFRGRLQLWMGGATLLLLLIQAAMLTWIFQPLRRVVNELEEIEAGQREQFDTSYPQELQYLTENLNGLIQGNRVRLRRYREALTDLAHSLKTPLAVLRAHEEKIQAQREAGQSDGRQSAIDTQLVRMEETINYHLQRAATSGRSPLSRPVPVAPEIERIVSSLRKVYHDKDLSIHVEVSADTIFNGETGDLAEILGNLLDNACKWAHGAVSVSARNESGTNGQRLLVLNIDDDGPGIPADQRDSVTSRGVRADTRVAGQGIGLAIVREMVVDIYGGQLNIATSATGGARIMVRI